MSHCIVCNKKLTAHEILFSGDLCFKDARILGDKEISPFSSLEEGDTFILPGTTTVVAVYNIAAGYTHYIAANGVKDKRLSEATFKVLIVSRKIVA